MLLDNEWKTRYETQHQINEQLEKQKIMLQDKLDSFKESSKSGKISLQLSLLIIQDQTIKENTHVRYF